MNYGRNITEQRDDQSRVLHAKHRWLLKQFHQILQTAPRADGYKIAKQLFCFHLDPFRSFFTFGSRIPLMCCNKQSVDCIVKKKIPSACTRAIGAHFIGEKTEILEEFDAQFCGETSLLVIHSMRWPPDCKLQTFWFTHTSSCEYWPQKKELTGTKVRDSFASKFLPTKPNYHLVRFFQTRVTNPTRATKFPESRRDIFSRCKETTPQDADQGPITQDVIVIS